LPHAQLGRRLEKEGRLFPHLERKDLKTADQCTMGLNFKTLRPRQDVLADYAHILERIYDPAAYGPSAASGEDARQFRPEAVDAPAAC